MSRQYFADTLGEPIGVDHATITATTETVLIPTIFTPIPAFEPRVGKVYELLVCGTVTTGASGTLIITPRFGTAIGGVSIGASATQNCRTQHHDRSVYIQVLSDIQNDRRCRYELDCYWLRKLALCRRCCYGGERNGGFCRHRWRCGCSRHDDRVGALDWRYVQRCPISYSEGSCLAFSELISHDMPNPKGVPGGRGKQQFGIGLFVPVSVSPWQPGIAISWVEVEGVASVDERDPGR